MTGNQPLVSIVLALYNPNIEWLKQQLESLNRQTYAERELLVMDDASDMMCFQEAQRCMQEIMTAMPWRLERSEENRGSTKTFEVLTEMARGTWIAYCDQDDIWQEDKISKLMDHAAETGALLICSDVLVIDEAGQRIADSLTERRKRHRFEINEQPSRQLLYRNFVLGCTMVVEAEIARAALPFVEDMVHDHYLTWYASTRGRVAVHPEALVRYRLHGGNQTEVLSGVTDKASYYERRIDPCCRRMQQLAARYPMPEVAEALEWAEARRASWCRERGGWRRLWTLRGRDRATSVFELLLSASPDGLFRGCLKAIKRGWV